MAKVALNTCSSNKADLEKSAGWKQKEPHPRAFCTLDPHEAFVAPLLLPSLRDRLLAAAVFAKMNVLLLPRKQVTGSAVLLCSVFLHGRNTCPLSRHLFV